MFDYFSSGKFSDDNEFALVQIPGAINVAEFVDRVLSFLLMSLLTGLHWGPSFLLSSGCVALRWLDDVCLLRLSLGLAWCHCRHKLQVVLTWAKQVLGCVPLRRLLLFVANHHLFDNEPIRVVVLLLFPLVLLKLIKHFTSALLCLVYLRLALLAKERSWCVRVVQMTHRCWRALCQADPSNRVDAFHPLYGYQLCQLRTWFVILKLALLIELLIHPFSVFWHFKRGENFSLHFDRFSCYKQGHTHNEWINVC